MFSKTKTNTKSHKSHLRARSRSRGRSRMGRGSVSVWNNVNMGSMLRTSQALYKLENKIQDAILEREQEVAKQILNETFLNVNLAAPQQQQQQQLRGSITLMSSFINTRNRDATLTQTATQTQTQTYGIYAPGSPRGGGGGTAGGIIAPSSPKGNSGGNGSGSGGNVFGMNSNSKGFGFSSINNSNNNSAGVTAPGSPRARMGTLSVATHLNGNTFTQPTAASISVYHRAGMFSLLPWQLQGNMGVGSPSSIARSSAPNHMHTHGKSKRHTFGHQLPRTNSNKRPSRSSKKPNSLGLRLGLNNSNTNNNNNKRLKSGYNNNNYNSDTITATKLADPSPTTTTTVTGTATAATAGSITASRFVNVKIAIIMRLVQLQVRWI